MLLTLSMIPTSALSEENAEALNSHLAVFKPLLGKTLRGPFANSTTENPVFDVCKWERAMNGQAVRTLHSVNEGEYGGETVIMWDPKREKIAFWYFTTAGFFTQGSFEIEGSTWTSIEDVTGDANGVSKVKSVTEIKENGELHVKSEYFVNDKWVPGHEVNYKVAPDAEVKFK